MYKLNKIQNLFGSSKINIFRYGKFFMQRKTGN
jgi:hypothetical protein